MKRLTCLIKGHIWNAIMRRTSYYETGALEEGWVEHRCARCGKVI